MNRKICVVLLSFAAFFVFVARPAVAEHSTRSSDSANTGSADTGSADGGQEKYLALPLAPGGANGKLLTRYGVPFVDRVLPLEQGGSAEVKVGGQAERIFLLGMTDAVKASDDADAPYSPAESGAPSLPGYGWNDPRDLSYLFIVGDELGRIRVDYVDGTEQVFPLQLGEGVWWGRAFYEFDQPFPADAELRQAFADALRLYPAKPLEDGNYVAVIDPKPVAIRSITIENSPAKKGTLVIKGITLETRDIDSRDPGGIAGADLPTPGVFPAEFEQFVKTRALRPLGSGEALEQQEVLEQKRLTQFKNALYSSEDQYRGIHVAPSAPAGYVGPQVSFKGAGEGAAYAGILANVFRYNVQDILAKIDDQGEYHTSTKDAICWGGYRGIGTFRYGVGRYYGSSYTRDMGRSMGEVATLGYTKDAERNAEYDLKMARRYATDPSLKFKGVQLPPHWGMLVNSYRLPSFENDGQGLTTLFLFKLWQQLPDRDAWLRAHWTDVKAAGDWVVWQLDHKDISGAKDGVLHTTGESANMNGYSVYPDAACMHALQGLAVMADSIGEKAAAEQWRKGADRLRAGITSHYIIDDPKYGRVWTLADSNWTQNSTVQGPLIFQADNEGFAPEDSYPEWRAANEAAYQRILDSYKPFGFYGQSMGYGQGFVTESALLLDRMRDATTMLDWAAKEIYDPELAKLGIVSYIVPEGARIDPTGHYWFRIGDLGNGVQEGEIVKTLRLVMGVDDTHPERLQFFPRLPYDWSEISVSKYPIAFETSGKIDTADLNYTLKRTGDRMDLQFAADQDLGRVTVRLGPFAREPKADAVRVNGKVPAGATVERSGDSWWVRFATAVGPESSESASR